MAKTILLKIFGVTLARNREVTSICIVTAAIFFPFAIFAPFEAHGNQSNDSINTPPGRCEWLLKVDHQLNQALSILRPILSSVHFESVKFEPLMKAPALQLFHLEKADRKKVKFKVDVETSELFLLGEDTTLLHESFLDVPIHYWEYEGAAQLRTTDLPASADVGFFSQGNQS